ncbi:MAG: hypothetical protein IKP34_06520 [Bacteroidales bacterium]|nr:hypothetical protein [Bacteroidales bacterium]
MKKLFLALLLLMAGVLYAEAQETKPYWVNNLPKPGNATYYFRVTHAEEMTYEKAYVRAFSMAILESSWKMGLPVDAKNDMATIENGVEDNLSIRSHQSNIAINKVCEYQTQSVTSNKVVLYVLWQVAASGNIEPRFEEFNKCR